MSIQIPYIDSLIQEIDLRVIWPDEAKDFSTWLSEKSNLAQLSNVLDLDLDCCGREVKTGHFRTDVLTTDKDSGNLVIIENQLEKSDHRHLGQCLTYMSYHNAKYCVWICKELQEEHRSALIKLNETTESDYRFYAVEIKAYKIENHKAYKFNVVVKPDFIGKYQQSIKDNRNPRVAQLNKFWEDFKQQLPEALQECFRIQYSGKQYANLTFYQKPFWMSVGFSKRDKKVRVGIYTTKDETFIRLKEIISESSFAYDNKKALETSDGKRNHSWHSFFEEKEYKETPKELYDWMKKSIESMYNSFSQINNQTLLSNI